MAMLCETAQKTLPYTWSQVNPDNCVDAGPGKLGVECQKDTKTENKTVTQYVCVEGGRAPNETVSQYQARAGAALDQAVQLWKGIPLVDDDVSPDFGTKTYVRFPLYGKTVKDEPEQEATCGFFRSMFGLCGGVSDSSNMYDSPELDEQFRQSLIKSNAESPLEYQRFQRMR